MTNASSGGALDGIKVVEMGQLIAGPFCGQLLGDMGAEVVKIEPPGGGDPMRDWGQGEPKTWWRVIARNKYSVALDLRSPEGQADARALIGQADILIENFRPGTLEKWGLDPAGLRAGNPRLIVVRVSGYGQTGPYSRRAGFGGIGEAMGGWRGIVGYPDLPPARMGVSIGDTLAATYGCMGVGPRAGSSTVTIASRAAKWGSASMASASYIRPAGTPASTIRSSSSSTVSVRVHAAINASSSSCRSPRARCVA